MRTDEPVLIRAAEPADLPAIVDIVNDAVLNSTALFEYEPHTLEQQAAWLAEKRADGWPVLVAECDGRVLGYATFGTFRVRPAYSRTVEHSIYVADEQRGRGVGRQLLEALIAEARVRGLHVMIGGIDGSNAASIAFHAAFGFEEVGRLREVGWKFERWLDLVYMQKIL